MVFDVTSSSCCVVMYCSCRFEHDQAGSVGGDRRDDLTKCRIGVRDDFLVSTILNRVRRKDPGDRGKPERLRLGDRRVDELCGCDEY